MAKLVTEKTVITFNDGTEVKLDDKELKELYQLLKDKCEVKYTVPAWTSPHHHIPSWDRCWDKNKFTS